MKITEAEARRKRWFAEASQEDLQQLMEAAAGGPVQYASQVKRALENYQKWLDGAAATRGLILEPVLPKLKPWERWPGVEDDLLPHVTEAYLALDQAEEDDAPAYEAAIEAFRCANAERIAAARLIESDKNELEPSDLTWICEKLDVATASFGAYEFSTVDEAMGAIARASGLHQDRKTHATALDDIRARANAAPLTKWRIVWYLALAMFTARWADIAEEYRRARTLRVSARLMESQLDLARIASVGEDGGVLDIGNRRLPGVLLAPVDDIEYLRTLHAAVPHFSSYLVPESLRYIYDSARLAYANHILRGMDGTVSEVVAGGLREVLRQATGNDDPPPKLVSDGRKLWRVMRGLVVPGLPQGMDATIIQWWEDRAVGAARSQLHLTYPPTVLPNFGRVMAEAGKDQLKRLAALPPWPRVVSKKPNLRAGERWLWWAMAFMFRDRAIEAAREDGILVALSDSERFARSTGLSINQQMLTLAAWVDAGDLVQVAPCRYKFGDRESWQHILTAGQLEAGGRADGRRAQANLRAMRINRGIQKLGL